MTKFTLTALALLLPAASALAHGDHAPVGPYAHPFMHVASVPVNGWLAIAAIGFVVAVAPWLLGRLWVTLRRAGPDR